MRPATAITGVRMKLRKKLALTAQTSNSSARNLESVLKTAPTRREILFAQRAWI